MVARIITPAAALTPIPTAAPGLTCVDEECESDPVGEGDEVEDVVVSENVFVDDGKEYVADPVLGRDTIDFKSDGAGAGKISLVGLEQFG